MKNILAFGDSLTWGFVAGAWTRHPFETRWPNVLASGLQGKARVIEEGMNGRTTVFPDPLTGEERNGAVGLPIALTSHQPLDLVIIMLGTNDLKYFMRCRAFDAALGMTRLIDIVKRYPFLPAYTVPKILIMAPPAIRATPDPFFHELWGHAIAESQLLPQHYARIAGETGVEFFDTNTVATTDPTDGGHLDAANTRAIGQALVPVVSRLLGV